MARITIEDCLKQIPNRFKLVNTVCERVKQIRDGSEFLITSTKNEDIVISLREIASRKIRLQEEGTEQNTV
ncbi:MAG: DNA-directed RNA polymerase subunit omega [Deltaproteobacteria bacterium]|nr:DNA-directed RNA polymerase subunit omega [Deltaproteobacteria bacterium]